MDLDAHRADWSRAERIIAECYWTIVMELWCYFIALCGIERMLRERKLVLVSA